MRAGDGVRAWNRAAGRSVVHNRILFGGVPGLSNFHSPRHSSHQFIPFQTVSMDRFAFPKDHPHRSAQAKVLMDYEIRNGHRSLVLTSVAGFAQLASNNKLSANVPFLLSSRETGPFTRVHDATRARVITCSRQW